MSKLRIIDRNGRELSIPIHVDEPGRSILSHLHSAGEQLIGQCGGHGICSQCMVEVHEGKVVGIQEPMAEPRENRKLACCVQPDPSEDVTVELQRTNFSNPKNM
ncbi:2Fe-2S iron-sulfur cluster binding domain-containing protein [Idiomarina abyssalis]|uniref:2Fe-2S iron-sulfur cluster binding domain-containing protein n=1 Tax=Idiomarina abyssalis TaxID=86102 RepID=UPI002278545D|nr:2Fe-2S iron-sulfur cluster binding domain-containing protein [Idiomarina abyssalis]